MAEYIMGILSIPLYLFEGYCIQFFFGRFAEPKLCRLRNAQWVVGIVWILIRIVGGWLFRETDSVTLIVELLFTTVSLFVFSVGWYKGNILLKVFFVIQFISLRELAFWAGYSFLYIGNSLIDILVYGASDSMESAGYLPVAAGALACLDPSKIHRELGWLPETKFEDGIKKTIEWYLSNREWWETIISGEYKEYYEKMYGNR